jgi:hypothetical protein
VLDKKTSYFINFKLSKNLDIKKAAALLNAAAL